MGRPLDTCALGMLEWLPQNPECERLALEFGVMLGHAMIAERGYAAPETRTIRLRAKTRFDDLDRSLAEISHCRFRKLHPFDSRPQTNQNMMAVW